MRFRKPSCNLCRRMIQRIQLPWVPMYDPVRPRRPQRTKRVKRSCARPINLARPRWAHLSHHRGQPPNSTRSFPCPLWSRPHQRKPCAQTEAGTPTRDRHMRMESEATPNWQWIQSSGLNNTAARNASSPKSADLWWNGISTLSPLAHTVWGHCAPLERKWYAWWHLWQVQQRTCWSEWPWAN